MTYTFKITEDDRIVLLNALDAEVMALLSIVFEDTRDEISPDDINRHKKQLRRAKLIRKKLEAL